MPPRSFQEVSVDISAGAGWVRWCIGELRVDPLSFELVFLATGSSFASAKPLGCLRRATAAAASQPGGKTLFIVDATDPVRPAAHGQFRFGFRTAEDERLFFELARSAELPEQRASHHEHFSGTASSSSSCRRASADALRALIERRHHGACPVVAYGAQLLGNDPRGGLGSEVALGRGAAVLLDPKDSERVGMYQLLFYDDTCLESILQLPVGPRTRLVPHPQNRSRDRSLVCFRLQAPEVNGVTLAFDEQVDAREFLREFNVRQQLVAVSMKVANGRHTLVELQDELGRRRQIGTCSDVCLQTVRWLVLLALVGLCGHVALLVAARSPEQTLLDVAFAALEDCAMAVGYAFTQAAELSMAAASTSCSLMFPAVPLEAAESCIRLEDTVEVRACMDALLRAA